MQNDAGNAPRWQGHASDVHEQPPDSMFLLQRVTCKPVRRKNMIAMAPDVMHAGPTSTARLQQHLHGGLVRTETGNLSKLQNGGLLSEGMALLSGDRLL